MLLSSHPLKLAIRASANNVVVALLKPLHRLGSQPSRVS
jgi:hypothetical protein